MIQVVKKAKFFEENIDIFYHLWYFFKEKDILKRYYGKKINQSQ